MNRHAGCQLAQHNDAITNLTSANGVDVYEGESLSHNRISTLALGCVPAYDGLRLLRSTNGRFRLIINEGARLHKRMFCFITAFSAQRTPVPLIKERSQDGTLTPCPIERLWLICNVVHAVPL